MPKSEIKPEDEMKFATEPVGSFLEADLSEVSENFKCTDFNAKKHEDLKSEDSEENLKEKKKLKRKEKIEIPWLTERC